MYAARWNPVGCAMVYAATSLALAALETFVHLEPLEEPRDLVSIAAEVPIDPEALLSAQRAMLEALPPDWQDRDSNFTQAIGAFWIESNTSLFLPVPSVVIEKEWNILLNPAHPLMAQVKLEQAEPFHFDKRMFRT